MSQIELRVTPQQGVPDTRSVLWNSTWPWQDHLGSGLMIGTITGRSPRQTNPWADQVGVAFARGIPMHPPSSCCKYSEIFISV